MIKCIKVLPAVVAAWLCTAESIATALGVRFQISQKAYAVEGALPARVTACASQHFEMQ